MNKLNRKTPFHKQSTFLRIGFNSIPSISKINSIRTLGKTILIQEFLIVNSVVEQTHSSNHGIQILRNLISELWGTSPSIMNTNYY